MNGRASRSNFGSCQTSWQGANAKSNSRTHHPTITNSYWIKLCHGLPTVARARGILVREHENFSDYGEAIFVCSVAAMKSS